MIGRDLHYAEYKGGTHSEQAWADRAGAMLTWLFGDGEGRWPLRLLRRIAIQHVREAAVQPRLAGRIVVLAVDGFVQHVRIVAAETIDFLLDALPRHGHQLPIALLPQFVSMRQRAGHPCAGGLDDMLVDDIGGDGRQLAVPEDDLGRWMGFAHGWEGFYRYGRIRVMIRWSLLLFLFVALPAAAQPQPVAQPALPIVRVIATGGTIAGVQDAPGTLGGYRAGTKSVGEIVQSVPELARFAEIETEQFSNVASTEIMPSQWLGLAKRINELLARPDLAGVVVTHGTDRLEETAFFLYLTVKSDKPVVVVGAQRPATGISPDGPINLLVRGADGRVDALARHGRDGGDGRPHHLGAREPEALPQDRRFQRRRDGCARHHGRRRPGVLLQAAAQARRGYRVRRDHPDGAAKGGARVLVPRWRGSAAG